MDEAAANRTAPAPEEQPVEIFGEPHGRPIFFIHGWQLTKGLEIADFEPALAGRPGWRRIYTDLPGMGARRGEGDGITNFNELLDWVCEFIDEEAPGEDFAIAGMSVGGQLARGVVERMPERSLGLLLRAPRLIAKRDKRSIFDPDNPPPAVRKSAEDPLGAVDDRNKRDAFLDQDDVGAQMPPRFKIENDERHAPWYRARQRGRLAVIERIEEEYELDPVPKAIFARPTLILVGRQDSRVGFLEALETGKEVRPEIGVSLQEQYPRATIVVLDRAGHALPVGSTEVFQALVRDWVARIEELL
jgi:pimeloyl-ACP methyl ester carboxylesterase